MNILRVLVNEIFIEMFYVKRKKQLRGYGNGDGVIRKGKRRVWNFGAAVQ